MKYTSLNDMVNIVCSSVGESSGFDLMTFDLYSAIVIELFTNHILAENTCFTNHIEWTGHKVMVLKL